MTLLKHWDSSSMSSKIFFCNDLMVLLLVVRQNVRDQLAINIFHAKILSEDFVHNYIIYLQFFCDHINA